MEAETDSTHTPKRILALDGGGVRGAFSVEILSRMEELLRGHTGRADLVLADHFQFMAGTSTGGIIASLLSWGEPVATIRQLYLERSAEIFFRTPLWKVWKLGGLVRALYKSESLARFLHEFFLDPATGKTAKLSTSRLRTTLLLCMRNATTGSAWPITNNPNAHYNRPGLKNCNLEIPLWQLVRASTAAPVYFLPEQISLANVSSEFMDGGTTPYNNPALIAFLMATLPCYKMEWPTGVDRLRLVSVGTGRLRSTLKNRSLRNYNFLTSLAGMAAGLIESVGLEQDLLCRVLGDCVFGSDIDREVGSLIDCGIYPREEKKFSYVRYDHPFSPEEEAAAKAKYGGGLTLDNLRIMPYLMDFGRKYAAENVRLEHLL